MENYFNNTIPHKNIIRQIKEMNHYGDFINAIRNEQLRQKYHRNIYEIASILSWKKTTQGWFYWETIKSIINYNI